MATCALIHSLLNCTMHLEVRAQYERFTEYIEEPIRDIVPAIWDLPFVVDMGFTCSGHILRKPEFDRPDFGDFSWYPHRVMLELAFSLDAELEGFRDAFRKDLADVSVEIEGLSLSFNDVRSREQDCLPYSRIFVPNLSEDWDARLPEVDKTEESVIAVERLLGLFWEQVADVVRAHNTSAQIGPIVGKDFRGIINWAHWRSVFLNEGCG